MKKTKLDKRRLNICPLEIYDGTLSEPRIGVKSSYSDTLLKNILTSVISDRGGLRSLDYAKKRYLGDWKRPVDLDPNAFDLETVHFLDVNIIELREHVIANSHNLIYSEIQAICDLTLARVLGTLRAALYLSSKGLLHEVLTLCRSSLEMLMWAFTTFDLSDDQDPFQFLPEKAVSGMKPYFPYTGKYYGYLSKFLHWRKETHTRVFRFEEEYTAVVYESGRNKWEAIANVILMTHLYAEAYIAKYSSLKCKADRKNFIPQVHALSSKLRKRQDEWLKFFTELDGQELSELFIEVAVSVGKGLNSE